MKRSDFSVGSPALEAQKRRGSRWYNRGMSKKKNLKAEIAGWYGAVAILLAYVFVSFELIAANGAVFQLLNLTGAIGIIIIAVHKNVKQSVILNIFWAGVAIVALLRLLIN